MATFSVTYEKWDDDALEAGDTDDRGYIAKDLPLREAVETVCETDSSQCEQTGIEANECPIRAPRWITVTNSADWIEGIAEIRSLHIPDHVTGATRRRIARLFGLKVAQS